MNNYIIKFDDLGLDDIDKVGGKNTSQGELLTKLSPKGIITPAGFAITTAAFQEFIRQDKLSQSITLILNELDIQNDRDSQRACNDIQELILNTQLPLDLNDQIILALKELLSDEPEHALTICSSISGKEQSEESILSPQERFLNVCGAEDSLNAIKKVYASLLSQQTISLWAQQNIGIESVALSVCIQKMVNSEASSAGVMYTLDTESGFDQVVFLTSAFGLGQAVVEGRVNPDEFYIHKESLKAGRPSILRRNLGAKSIKVVHCDSSDSASKDIRVDRKQRLTFSLNDDNVINLAKQALIIEEYYQCPMEIEWAKEDETGKIYIVQVRPENIKNRAVKNIAERYILRETGNVLAEGRSVGHKIGSGPVKIIDHRGRIPEINEGDVLVAEVTDPDWEPAMKKASAIVTNRGGRTCHAAIIARELGIPAVVGCGDATDILKEGQQITVSCAEGDTGFIYNGALNFEHKENSMNNMPKLPFKLMMNIGNPDRAFDFQALPNEGVGLARLEFIINRMIGVHPKALLNFYSLPPEIKTTVERRIAGYSDPIEFYVEKLTEGISTLAAAFWPKKVIVRLSDFKSNEYANLIGGRLYEPEEENPMLGFRGASRYISKSFRDCFELECRAIKKVRNEMGFTNIELMVPFVRTLGEAKQVVELLSENGLTRGENDLRIIMMCELPANALLADQFLEYFDGMSIGSNDLTQLTLGLDRDSSIIAHLFDERNEATLQLMHMAISACKKQGKYIGICGQGPNDHPDFAQWLMEEGIDSVSLNPDSVLDTWFYLAEKSQ